MQWYGAWRAMRRVALLGSLLLVARAEAGDSNEHKPGTIEIVKPALTYHSDETAAETGQVWFGLFRDGPRGTLQRVRLTVGHVEDGVMGDPPASEGGNPSVWTGKAVRADSSRQPIFLVRGLGRSKPGAVPTVSVSATKLLPGIQLPLRTRGVEDSELVALGTAAATEFHGTDPAVRDYHLALRTPDGRSQVLDVPSDFRALEVGMGGCDLVWAGDLDGDARVDLLIDCVDHYNIQMRWTLFLSSAARDGELVHAVAELLAVGC